MAKAQEIINAIEHRRMNKDDHCESDDDDDDDNAQQLQCSSAALEERHFEQALSAIMIRENINR
jgi:hypothetical protein